jgi:hypothetical protein
VFLQGGQLHAKNDHLLEASVLARIFFKGGIFNPLQLHTNKISKALNHRKNSLFGLKDV